MVASSVYYLEPRVRHDSYWVQDTESYFDHLPECHVSLALDVASDEVLILLGSS